MYFIQTSNTLNAVYSTVFEEFRYFLNCIYVSCFLYMFYVIKQDIRMLSHECMLSSLNQNIKDYISVYYNSFKFF